MLLVLFWAAVAVAALVAVRAWASMVRETDPGPELGLYETALLVAGDRRVGETALAALIDGGKVVVPAAAPPSVVDGARGVDLAQDEVLKSVRYGLDLVPAVSVAQAARVLDARGYLATSPRYLRHRLAHLPMLGVWLVGLVAVFLVPAELATPFGNSLIISALAWFGVYYWTAKRERLTGAGRAAVDRAVARVEREREELSVAEVVAVLGPGEYDEVARAVANSAAG